VNDWEMDELFEEWADEYLDSDEPEDLWLDYTIFLSQRVFLSDNDLTPNMTEDYYLGQAEPEQWWPLVLQLDLMVNMSDVLMSLEELDELLDLPGLPSAVLEDPLAFLGTALAGNLPKEPSGRKVGSPKLVKIAQAIILLERRFPQPAQTAVESWANLHRPPQEPFPGDFLDMDLADYLPDPDLPPAMSGFSALLALTLMRYPERTESIPMPPDLLEPDLYHEFLGQWELLPDSPTVAEGGAGGAEALFAQGQLAHILAQTGAIELASEDDLGEEATATAYSRLSRAILWVHNRCRGCTERREIACRAATGWQEGPVPLLDIAGEFATTGQIAGCILMSSGDA